MLILKNISKDYVTGAETVHALNGVSVAFRKNEFVSVLGPSGCGKTTLLNIIGGLDRYNKGDLVINGRHTYGYTARDWDTYRNHSVGFVFQNYNLIPHQTVLANVELALTISGVSKAERRRRAIEVLKRVGLGDQIKKKPTQMSGGQMQRVAIARALVNNPEILLADEPTGALDTETSVQIMDLLKEIASDRLVIMVTHNPELAEQYSTRIIRLLDGKVAGDTDPYELDEAEEDAKAFIAAEKAEKTKKKKKAPSMSFKMALSLSFRNLMTKKTRTILTAFAGSIGIIGIALILSISNGMSAYISTVQQDTMSSYPLVLNQQTSDADAYLSAIADSENAKDNMEKDKIYVNDTMFRMLTASMSTKYNNLKKFRQHLIDTNATEKVGTIMYSYANNFDVFRVYDEDEVKAPGLPSSGVVQANPDTVMSNFITQGTASLLSGFGGMSLFQEIPYIENEELIKSQYDCIEGRFPSAPNEIVLVLDSSGRLPQHAVYALGLRDINEVFGALQDPNGKHNVEMDPYNYSDFLNMTLKLVPEHLFLEKGATVAGTQIWQDVRNKNDYNPAQFIADNEEDIIDLDIVGILRPNEDATVASIQSPLGYTSALTKELIKISEEAEIVKWQKANPTINAFTGVEFVPTPANGPIVSINPANITNEAAMEYFASLVDSPKMQMAYYTAYTTYNYDKAFDAAGGIDEANPTAITFIPSDFHTKDVVKELIDSYNDAQTDPDDKITFVDTMEVLFSSITIIIDAITWVLVAFVAISLIVSSIMIGIITYISVLERTKEIGVLRSIGASRRDVANVFNAETTIVGLTSGLLGILLSLIILIPINSIIESLSGIANMAFLAPGYAIGLVAISMILTVIAGLFPAMLASRKDPAVALRSE